MNLGLLLYLLLYLSFPAQNESMSNQTSPKAIIKSEGFQYLPTSCNDPFLFLLLYPEVEIGVGITSLTTAHHLLTFYAVSHLISSCYLFTIHITMCSWFFNLRLVVIIIWSYPTFCPAWQEWILMPIKWKDIQLSRNIDGRPVRRKKRDSWFQSDQIPGFVLLLVTVCCFSFKSITKWDSWFQSDQIVWKTILLFISILFCFAFGHCLLFLFWVLCNMVGLVQPELASILAI